eukprot:CAMPEP_0203686470 /NCGR_PEP_ID=MMETSP0090-20130426/49076_1 /ASSEMBLY_ACC=CAM_ASM_001088 /TAXON_ID=426623 /ORGANISM="Chaetoceros affinis, Strain CCMP159" /LENGTH=847 /DNA_ID=CAMNT_0050555695 /DNA_START=380 /DNA_END=2919 /DNA_ORIENTATION=+
MKTANKAFYSSPKSPPNTASVGSGRKKHGRDSLSMHLSPRKYFSRKFASRVVWHELPLEKNARGINTPVGIFFLLMRLTVPLAYIYIFFILLREICNTFPDTCYSFLQNYIFPLHYIVQKMEKKSSFAVEIWVVTEALFYIVQILHIRYLQFKDPLEASLSAAPVATLYERDKLMNQVMDHIVDDDPVSFVRGWFFDVPLEDITRYDVMDFFAWCMFEGRNQEHLTEEEVGQLNWFVREVECRIGVFLYGFKEDQQEEEEGAKEDGGNSSENGNQNADQTYYMYIEQKERRKKKKRRMIYFKRSEDSDMVLDPDDIDLDDDQFQLCVPSFEDSRGTLSKSSTSTFLNRRKRYQPKKNFQFPETTHDTTPGFFTNLYENYNQRYEQYKNIQKMQPVQNIRNFVAVKRQQLVEAEEHAMAAASNMYEHAYSTFIHRGSAFDKRIAAISNATHQQLNDAWNSVGNLKERIETARFVSSRKRFLQQQNRGYKMLLERIIHSSSVPPRQMVDLMRKITQCNESLEMIEDSAMDAFLSVTGFARKHLLQQKKPMRYAKYTEDELLGLAIYPLVFNVAILGLTDGLLRVLMARRGFERLNIGTTVYYFHRGDETKDYDSDNCYNEDRSPTPIVFCHGIGIGLAYYLSLIDELLKLGRPIFLPEIPYVCGFRPWISRKSILTPPAVVSTLSAMLASHGHMKASFIGHSYGTSWVSFMCKYASDTVASLLFLDPICFCLHHPCLTKSFVYHRADPGSVSYMVKTDVIINWTIQRSFPWARIILFVEDIPKVPCSIYISEQDVLIPVETVERYLKLKGAHFCDEKDAGPDHFQRGPINVTIFRGEAHGDWTERPSTA